MPQIKSLNRITLNPNESLEIHFRGFTLTVIAYDNEPTLRASMCHGPDDDLEVVTRAMLRDADQKPMIEISTPNVALCEGRELERYLDNCTLVEVTTGGIGPND